MTAPLPPATVGRMPALTADEPDEPTTKELDPLEAMEMPERELVEIIYQIFEEYRTCQQRATMEKIWLACMIAYKGLKPRRMDPMKDSLVMKEIFRQAHTLKPQIFKQFFSQPQLFRYAPMVPNTDDKMRVATETVHYQIRQFKQLPQIKNFVWCHILMGTSYCHPHWRNFKRPYMKPFRLEDPKKGSFWKRETKEIFAGYPCFEFIAPNEIFSHPDYEDPRNSPFVFRRRLVSGAELKTYVREDYLDAAAIQKVAEKKLGASMEVLQDQYKLLTQQYDVLGLNSLPNDDIPHEMLEVWCSNGMGYVVIDAEVLARAQMIEGGIHREDGELQPGEIPILCLRNYPQIGEHWGIPEPYTILDDQALLNNLYTMLQETLKWSGPMLKATRQGGKELSNFTAKTGAILWVNRMDDAEIIPPTTHADKIISGLGFVANNCKQVSGLFDNLAGSGDEGTNTASMGIKLQNAATVRIEDRVEDAVPIMEELFGYGYTLNQRHLRAPVAFSIKGDDGVRAFHTGLPEHFDEPLVQTEVQLANAMAADPEEANKWMQFYQLAGKDPIINRRPVLKAWLRSLDRRAPGMYLSSPETTMQDSLEENREWEAWGEIKDPDQAENHDLALQVHKLEENKPEFITADPLKKQRFYRHEQLHMNYQQAMLAQSGKGMAASPAGPNAPNGAPVPQANAAANGMMNMAASGAAQAGAPPPPPNPNAGMQAGAGPGPGPR